MRGLSPERKKVIREMGFEDLIEFLIFKIPTKLVFYVVDILNTTNMMLECPMGEIVITPKIVKQVLGLPMRRMKLEREGQREYNDPFLLQWKDQLRNSSILSASNFQVKGLPQLRQRLYVLMVSSNNGFVDLLTELPYGKIIQMSIVTQRSLEDFEAQQNVAKVQERVEDEELGQMLDKVDNVDVDVLMDDVLNSQEATDTRIDLGSYKESIKAKKDANMVTTHDEEVEEESAGDKFELKRREKGNGIEETKDTSPLVPIRSPKTHISLLSLDKETLKELIVIIEDAPLSLDKEKLKELTNTDPSPSSSTPSSSSPNPKTGRFKQCKSFIHQMGGCYGLLFGHLTKTFMLKKNFNQLSAMLYEALKEMIPSMVNKIAKTTILIYVTKGLLLERQKNQVNTAAMITEAIQKERENLYAEVISQVNDVVANHIPP
ncbi:hypothetical protein Tco_0316323 [Tanacetum coccineum]